MELADLRRDSTKITLLQFTNEVPQEGEIKFLHTRVDCPDVMRACAEIDSTQGDIPQATRYLLTCELKALMGGRKVEFTPELFDIETQNAIAVKIFEPMFREIHKFDGFTSEEQITLRLAESCAAISWRTQASENIIHQARKIIRRKQDEHKHQQV